nr:MAG TPA: minor structural protein [Caudoviricetes sp.]
MKREDLKAIEGLTEEQINAVMRLHGLDAAAHQATVQGLQAQLATAQQGLAAFDGVDINDLRSQITNLTNQLSQQAAEFTFTGVLRAAAHEAGALDENDAIALLPNRATLRESKNQAEDVKQAFSDLKSRKPYLFQQGAPAPQDGAGPQPGAEPQEPTNPIIVPKPRSQGGNAQPTLQEFLAMTGAERMALRTRNPALFQQLSALVRAARH